MNWQEIAVVLIFAGALVFMGTRAYRLIFAKKKAGCDHCELPSK